MKENLTELHIIVRTTGFILKMRFIISIWLAYFKYYHCAQLCTEETTATTTDPSVQGSWPSGGKQFEVFMNPTEEPECQGKIRFREKNCPTCRVS